MRIHFIAIGGAAMHNLALALKQKDYIISGSDDEIFEPSLSRLKNANILPKEFGWYPEKISPDIDAVILGMHALEDNPELKRARELGLNIYSYPEFLYEQTKNKKRVVIGGSHGKTTITSMVMHVLRANNVKFDYMVGAQIEGFETMVSLSDDTEIAIFEGDEYLSSPIDRRPKFHLYKPHIALISGIGWDHINVFPTFENYLKQFKIFIDKIVEGGQLFYYNGDANIKSIVEEKQRTEITYTSYSILDNEINNGVTSLIVNGGERVPLEIFGEHNVQNLSGAKEICMSLEITEREFYSTISSFKGSAKRLQCIYSDKNKRLFIDFAHSPSKLKGTIDAVQNQFSNSEIIAVFELHTFSSLNKKFLGEYKGTFDAIENPIVFFNPEVVKHKKLPDLNGENVKDAFCHASLSVVTSIEQLKGALKAFRSDRNQVYLFMSSGNFNGLSSEKLKEMILD